MVTIDFASRCIVIGDDESLRTKMKGAKSYQDNNGCPVVDFQVGSMRSSVRLDSGSEMGLTIPSRFLPQLHLIGKARPAGKARPMFREFNLYQIRVSDAVTIAGLKFPTDDILVNDIFPEPNLGSRAMQSLRITLDRKHRRVLMETPSFEKGPEGKGS